MRNPVTNLAPDVARIVGKGETMAINLSIFHGQPISGMMIADKLVFTKEKVNKTTRIKTCISELAYIDDTGFNLHILLSQYSQIVGKIYF
jgi:hypothetical protein